MPKSQPTTLRLSLELDRWVSSEAARTHRSKGVVIESLAEEALKARLFPGVAFRGDDWDRRAWVVGTGLDVWQIVRAFQDLGSAEAVVEAGSATAHQVHLALSYYERFPEEVDLFISRDRRSVEDLRAAYPSIAIVEV